MIAAQIIMRVEVKGVRSVHCLLHLVTCCCLCTESRLPAPCYQSHRIRPTSPTESVPSIPQNPSHQSHRIPPISPTESVPSIPQNPSYQSHRIRPISPTESVPSIPPYLCLTSAATSFFSSCCRHAHTFQPSKSSLKSCVICSFSLLPS